MPSATRSSRHAHVRRDHRALRAVGLTVAGVLAFGGTAAAMVNYDLQRSLNVQDIDGLLGTDRPTLVEDPTDPYAGKQLNILVMGTDMRDAENAALAGDADTMASDTTMIVHISGDRKHVEVVSIPRDSMVEMPSCTTGDGGTSYASSYAMFNSAFAIGAGSTQNLETAAACTVKTVEHLTGVRITSHVVLKMTGVVDVVDALDGVEVTLDQPIKGDPRYTKIDLPAGKQTLDGKTAIEFLRVRKGPGMDGSDLGRITRQQFFLNAMADQMLSQNLVTDSPKLYAVVKSVLGAMSTSADLGTTSALAGLAFSLQHIRMDDVVFTELPLAADPRDKNRVVWRPEADAIWQRIIADEPAPSSSDDQKGEQDGSADEPSGSTTAGASATS
ncbi:LCP family protein [Sanguibacter sp. A247]|uniref:LCP family protein n=1 Tax=unclassified Sanguibacter TaxID=2645534 RepID=UPI003FD6CD23